LLRRFSLRNKKSLPKYHYRKKKMGRLDASSFFPIPSPSHLLLPTSAFFLHNDGGSNVIGQKRPPRRNQLQNLKCAVNAIARARFTLKFTATLQVNVLRLTQKRMLENGLDNSRFNQLNQIHSEALHDGNVSKTEFQISFA
jgi:hypothetical protein